MLKNLILCALFCFPYNIFSSQDITLTDSDYQFFHNVSGASWKKLEELGRIAKDVTPENLVGWYSVKMLQCCFDEEEVVNGAEHIKNILNYLSPQNKHTWLASQE